MLKTVRNGKSWSSELVNKKKEGGTYYVELTISPVKDSQGKVVRFLVIQRDISQRKELEELKDNFIANVSHELRTPLSIISLNTYSLLNYFDKISNEKKIKLLKGIEQQIQIQQEIVEQILTNSRLDEHKIKFNPEDLQLAEILNNVYLEYEERAKQKSLDYTLAIESDLPIIRGDKYQIKEILKNIILNAIKYTASGSVKIKARTKLIDGKIWICIDVEDTGFGISEIGQRHIFERFYRADMKYHPRVTGTGLGLYLCNQFIKNHSGRITFQSELNKGSKFTIWLPGEINNERV